MKNVLALLALGAACILHEAYAQAQFQNEDPFKAIVGKWKTNEGQYSSRSAEVQFADKNTNWAGKMYGLIKPSGMILFKAENGCILSGLASPFASDGQWSVNGRLEGCKIDHFNQKVFGTIRMDGASLQMELTDPPFSVGTPPVGYFIKARMTQY